MSSIGSIFSSVVLASSIITSVIGVPVSGSQVQQRSLTSDDIVTLAGLKTNLLSKSLAGYSVMSLEGVAAVQPDTLVSGKITVENEAISYLTGFDSSYALVGLDTRDDNLAYLAMMKAYTDANPATAAVLNQDRTSASLEDGDALLDGSSLLPTTAGLFAPGVYDWTTAVVLGAGKTMVLKGLATDSWLFRSTGEFSTGADSRVQLIGGALAQNVYWVGATSVTVGANSLFQGNILTYTNVVIGTQSELVGKIFSQTEVALQRATVSDSMSGPWQCGTSAC